MACLKYYESFIRWFCEEPSNRDGNVLTKKGIDKFERCLKNEEKWSDDPLVLRYLLMEVLQNKTLCVDEIKLDRFLTKYNRLPWYDPISACVLLAWLDGCEMSQIQNDKGFNIVERFDRSAKDIIFDILEGRISEDIGNHNLKLDNVMIYHDSGKDPAQDDIAAIMALVFLIKLVNKDARICLVAQGADPEMSFRWAHKITRDYTNIYHYIGITDKTCKARVQTVEVDIDESLIIDYEEFKKFNQLSNITFVHSFYSNIFCKLFNEDRDIFENTRLVLQGAGNDKDVPSTFNEKFWEKNGISYRNFIFSSFEDVTIHTRTLAYNEEDGTMLNRSDIERLGDIYYKKGIVASSDEFVRTVFKGTKDFCKTGPIVFSRLPAFCNLDLYTNGPYHPMLEDIIDEGERRKKNYRFTKFISMYIKIIFCTSLFLFLLYFSKSCKETLDYDLDSLDLYPSGLAFSDVLVFCLLLAVVVSSFF